ncbi:DUF6782 family putative metallopeptidase, partial [Salmonella enterica]|uniref:DUF6782 family putative metallopeptidase n=1 Tax=Salmonella enterica TaxID=28901 RepID=UPI0015DF9400
HQSSSVEGYYWIGTGAIGLSQGMANPACWHAPRTLVHEIRHAWQDSKGLLADVSRDFHETAVKLSLWEADASAHGHLAHVQERPRLRADQAREEILTRGFLQWYAGFAPMQYGRALVGKYGPKLGADHIPPRPSNDLEFNQPVQGAKGFDPSRLEEVYTFGQGFDGHARNYFHQPG